MIALIQFLKKGKMSRTSINTMAVGEYVCVWMIDPLRG